MKTDDEQDEHKGDKKNKHDKSSPKVSRLYLRSKNFFSSNVNLKTIILTYFVIKDNKHTNEHHSAPSTDLKAGLKDDLDRFDGKTEEFVHGDVRTIARYFFSLQNNLILNFIIVRSLNRKYTVHILQVKMNIHYHLILKLAQKKNWIFLIRVNQ